MPGHLNVSFWHKTAPADHLLNNLHKHLKTRLALQAGL